MNLINDCCLNALNSVPAASVDLICADMPYGTTNCSWDSLIDLDNLWPKLLRVAKPSSAIVLFAQSPFDKVLASSNLSMFRYEWIWEKTAATGFFNAKKMPMKAHENILVFYKRLPTYNPEKTRGHARKTAGRVACNSPHYGKAVKKTHYDSTERYPRSVLKYSSDKQRSKLHPTQKPLALIEYLIKTYTNEGDNVLDFCMGSGTAGVASQNTGRLFTGIEKDAAIFETARRRINQNIAMAA